MSKEVKVPSMGESITSGILATWHVKDGDFVKKEDPLFELETDKITSDANAETDGVISLKVEEGEEVEIGQVVAEIDENAKAGSNGSREKEQETGDNKEESEKEPPAADEKPQKEEEESDKVDTSTNGKEAKKEKYPPSVQRIADESGIDPSTVEGSGKGGRVTKGDMLEAQKNKEEESVKKEEEQEPATEIEDRKPDSSSDTTQTAVSSQKSDEGEKKPQDTRTTRRKMSPMRQRIAQRLVEAQNTAALLTTFNEVDMSAVINLRKQYKEEFQKRYNVKLGFMSFFVKACVHALKSVPAVNSQIHGSELVQNHFYDIGVAVSTDRGLLVPVVRDCDQKSFAEIEKGIHEFAEKARDGKIEIEDIQGGVFTITNGGIFGSMLSTPIVNMPQSGILGMHTIQDRPVARDGQVVIRPMMYLAHSYDHRIIDGKEAVTFLYRIKEAIEDPTRLLFEV